MLRRRVHRTPAGVWGRVGLGVVLGSAVTQWAYPRACDWWLLLYFTVVGIAIMTGMWGAVSAWQRRMALAHVVALATIIWGLALGTHEVLPRVGYAKTRAVWRCTALPAAPSPSPAIPR
jgi:heme A synthase